METQHLVRGSQPAHVVSMVTRCYWYTTHTPHTTTQMTVRPGYDWCGVLAFSCLICSLEKSIPGLALSRSDRSSAPPNTGVTEELGGDRPWGVTEPGGLASINTTPPSLTTNIPNTCSATSASFWVSGLREGVAIPWARAVSSSSWIRNFICRLASSNWRCLASCIFTLWESLCSFWM